MALTTKTETIGGKTYQTETLPATQALSILGHLCDQIGEKEIEFAFALDEDQREQFLGADTPGIAAARKRVMIKVLGTLNNGGIEQIKLLLSKTYCDQTETPGVPQDGVKTPEVGSVADHFDTHFGGDLLHLFAVIVWVGTVNFAAL